MGEPEDQRTDIEAELGRIYGGSSHMRVAHDPAVQWPETDVARILAILRSIPDNAGEEAVIRALGIRSEDVWRRKS
jgi:hypothetical protein